jgi:ornithine carbamoyltransferase
LSKPLTRSAHKDFLSLRDLSRDELVALLRRAERLKAGEGAPSPLRGKSLAMIFRKNSTRTRVAFEVGMYQLGGQALFLSAGDTQIGREEPIADTARVLGRYVHGIMIRTFDQEEVEQLARWAPIPVVNGLTDLLHPCQLLADLMTVREEFGAGLGGIRVAWIGDGNNMANSWLNAASILGFELALACPPGFDPDPEILGRARSLAPVRLTRSPREAVEGADVVTTDVWASMGQEDEAKARRRAFAGHTVDDALMARASRRSIFLHCLPAHRGEEVTESVLEGPRSRVFREAENRLHTQKALLIALLGEEGDG